MVQDAEKQADQGTGSDGRDSDSEICGSSGSGSRLPGGRGSGSGRRLQGARSERDGGRNLSGRAAFPRRGPDRQSPRRLRPPAGLWSIPGAAALARHLVAGAHPLRCRPQLPGRQLSRTDPLSRSATALPRHQPATAHVPPQHAQHRARSLAEVGCDRRQAHRAETTRRTIAQILSGSAQYAPRVRPGAIAPCAAISRCRAWPRRSPSSPGCRTRPRGTWAARCGSRCSSCAPRHRRRGSVRHPTSVDSRRSAS